MHLIHQAAPSSFGPAVIHTLLASAPQAHLLGTLSSCPLRLAGPGRPLLSTLSTWYAQVKATQYRSNCHSSPTEGCHLLPWLAF
eukprot:156044-Pyramimonas_sp.AAC.1